VVAALGDVTVPDDVERRNRHIGGIVRIEAARTDCPNEHSRRKTVMPPTKKSAPAKEAAPVAKAATPAKKAVVSARKTAAPGKKAAPVQAAPQITVTLKQIAAELAEGHDLPKKQAEAVLGDLVALATRHLKNGDKIRLTGLGILQVQQRAARMGRNPATGEAIQIKASKKIAFRPAKELKEAV
jgi:DNA-binding protein HU-beta